MYFTGFWNKITGNVLETENNFSGEFTSYRGCSGEVLKQEVWSHTEEECKRLCQNTLGTTCCQMNKGNYNYCYARLGETFYYSDVYVTALMADPISSNLGENVAEETEEITELDNINIVSVNQKLFPCPSYGPGLSIEWDYINSADNYLIEYNEGDREWKSYLNVKTNWTNFLEPRNSRNCTINNQFCSRCIKFNQVYNFRVKARDNQNNDLTDWSEVVSGVYVYTEFNETSKVEEEIEKPINLEIWTLNFLRESLMPSEKPSGTAEKYNSNSLPIEKHPVVLYTDVNLIRERIKNEPYKTWWENIKADGKENLNKNMDSFRRISRSRYSKEMAFIYDITRDERYGNKSRELLLEMNKGDISDTEYEETLLNFAEAYDILKGADYEFNTVEIICKKVCETKIRFTWKRFFYKREVCTNVCEDFTKKEEKIRTLLKNNMENLAVTDYGEIASDKMVRTNNLHIRRYSVVGTTALVLHDKGFFNNAMNGGKTLGKAADILDPIVKLFIDRKVFDYNGVSYAINYQTIDDEEGGWAEGPNYMRYTFLMAIPFMKAMENSEVTYNWFYVQKFNNLMDWAVKIRMPNGARPPYDDSSLEESYFFGGYLNTPLYNWDWTHADKKYFTNLDYPSAKIDAISYYDSSIGEEEPQWAPTQFLPKTGNIVLRSGWDDKDVYLMMLGENGRALDDTVAGNTHEHSDVFSFILYAYGKYLAIDSGYSDYDNREKTSGPKNHNVILRNSIPVSSEGYIQMDDAFSLDFLDYGEVKDSNNNDERGVLFIDKKYFLVYDILNDYKTSSYEWIIHGNGLESDKTFNKYLVDGKVKGGEWNDGNVFLLSYSTENPSSISFKKDIHFNAWKQESWHTSMHISKKSIGISFLNLLYPAENRDYPVVTQDKIDITSKISLDILKLQKDDWRGIAFVNKDNQLVSLGNDSGNIKTDASKLFVKIKNEKLDYIFADDAKQFYIGDKLIFDSPSLTLIVIVFEDNEMKIYYKDNGDIKFYKKSDSVIYNQNTRSDLYNSGVVSL